MSEQNNIEVFLCPKLSKKGFSLTEITICLVMIFVIATLATPSYYRMIHKFQSAAAAASARATLPALIVYWDEKGSFLNFRDEITVPEHGGLIKAGNQFLGAHLPEMDNIRWDIVYVTRDSLSIEWSIEGCDDCREGLEIEIKTAENGAAHYPKWSFYHYQ